MRIGSYELKNRILLAPMAGITDQPFRRLCAHYGVGLTFSEMMSTNPQVWHTEKSKLRLAHSEELGLNAVQIAGSDPLEMAQAAAINVAYGAEIIDINMGCPAKKVNRKLAGSALLQFPDLVEKILKEVVNAVDVPVTLKIRTGWNKANRNCVQIGKIAEQSGIQALTIHGRTKECLFEGEAEYDNIRAVKQSISIPVIANGDIDSAITLHYCYMQQGAATIFVLENADSIPVIVNGCEGQIFLSKNLETTRNAITWIDVEQNIQFAIQARLSTGDLLHIAESVSLDNLPEIE